MAFTDDFNRANENLEDSAGWTRVGGAFNAAKIVSNQLEHSSGTNTAFQCTDQATADHYTQVVNRETGNHISFQACTRLTDSSNFFGVKYATSGTKWEIFKRDTGSLTSLGSYNAGSIAGGEVVYLKSDASDVHTFILDGTTRITTSADAFNSTETRQGVVVRTSSGAWLDDFEAGPLAAGGATILPMMMQHSN